MRNIFISVCAWGLVVGLGVYLFGYARGLSYLQNDPAACNNCHVMQSQYDGWTASSHKQAAGCNDCHTPPGVLAAYGTKALNGYLHSYAFTTGRFPDTILITQRNKDITRRACAKCHAPVVEAIGVGRENADCLRCHATVGHP